MKEIICLTDYKGYFGTKWNAMPYRSGLDKILMQQQFNSFGYSLNFIPFNEVDFLNKDWSNKIIIYTSSEEKGLHFKNFIEDVVFGLKELGATLLPDPIFLRANNNKVFMELVRDIKLPKRLQTINSLVFGTYDELQVHLSKNTIPFPCVVKTSAGAMSRGVYLARSEVELRRLVKRISYSSNLKLRLIERIREFKHSGYMPESSNQKKFIIQPFIKDLQNDWKVLIYGEKYFLLKRNVRKNDFRASGSGYNYKSGSDSDFPIEYLTFLRDFYYKLDVPNLSVDFATDGINPYIFEFQAIHFGTSTHYKSKDYYEFSEGSWKLQPNNLSQEEVFVKSIVDYLRRSNA